MESAPLGACLRFLTKKIAETSKGFGNFCDYLYFLFFARAASDFLRRFTLGLS